MTIYKAIIGSFTRSLIWTSGLSVIGMIFYAQISVREIETSSIKLVAAHATRLTESSALRNDQLSIQREINRFVRSVIDAQGINAYINVSIGDDLVATVGTSEDRGFFSRNIDAIQDLPSGARMKLSGWLDFERQYWRWVALAIAVILIANFGFGMTYYYVRKSIQTVTTPMSDLSFWLNQISQDLPQSLAVKAPQLNANSTQEVSDLARSASVLLERLAKFYQEQGEVARLRARYEIAAQVSHDIRSPLTAINAAIKTASDIDPERLNLIQSASMRINEIANDLLADSRVQNTAIAVKRENLTSSVRNSSSNLDELVAAVVAEKSVEFSERINIKLQCDLNEAKGLVFYPESSQFCRALSNLLNNSVEAIGECPGIVRVSVRDYKDRFVISIQDNGSGIPESIISKIGERGFSFGKGNSQSGTGLGVHHARSFTEDSGGKFIIQSRAGMGTIVMMQFPHT